MDVLRRSTLESDRKFWSGELRITSVQGLGLLLMFLAVVGAAVLGLWPRGEGQWWQKIVNAYGVSIAILVCVVLFLVLGNCRSRNKSRRSSQRD